MHLLCNVLDALINRWQHSRTMSDIVLVQQMSYLLSEAGVEMESFWPDEVGVPEMDSVDLFKPVHTMWKCRHINEIVYYKPECQQCKNTVIISSISIFLNKWNWQLIFYKKKKHENLLKWKRNIVCWVLLVCKMVKLQRCHYMIQLA